MSRLALRHRVLRSLVATAPALFAALASGQEKPPEDKAEKKDQPPTIAAKTEGCTRRDGLLVTYVDERSGKLWLEVPPAAGPRGEVGRYLYVESLLTGLGSNPVGLDRGQLGATHLVAIRRIGGRVLIEAENLRYRALSENADERRAVRESFAPSILWAGEVAAADEAGAALVDLTPFIVRDAHGVAQTLRQSGQGGFSLDEKRSVIDLEGCLAFPDNLEFEALLTFSSSEPGGHVRETAADANSVTLVQHHSLIRLPDDGYTPRRFDPRVGFFGVEFADYAAPLTEPLEKRWIARHRLEKTDPAAARSPVKKPIIYYVDRGAPEPVRTALIEGASWWTAAFEKAGFADAFRVELMPEGAHPLDVRYNVIQWVHRSTRGWSYGGAIADPRTGEIIKGHVSLGSLRVRQDRLIFEGLAGTEKTGSGAADDPVQLALARIRQLSAHEVGHTLGLTHNFAASAYDGRASVMDYPAPLVKPDGAGGLDFSAAYAVGVGSWDVHCIRYGYGQFPPGADENAGLERIIGEGQAAGLRFISDADARPLGGAHPAAHLWDNGDDALSALRDAMRVRRIALDNFGERNIRPGTPVSLLHEVLVPVYLHHRYQAEAAVKLLGGLEYEYAVRGAPSVATRPVGAEVQREALDVLLECLQPAFLDIPDDVLALLAPRPFGYGANREMFESQTSPAFDALAAAATGADMVLEGLLHPQRCARLIDFSRRDEGMPGLGELLARVKQAVFQPSADESRRLAAIRRGVQRAFVARLISLSSNGDASPAVKSQANWMLAVLQSEFRPTAEQTDEEAAHRFFMMTEIQRYLNRPHTSVSPTPAAKEAPPGSPIGTTDAGWCGFAMP